MQPEWSVLQVAYPLAPVGPDAVGGAEQILSRLDVALTGRGSQSLVIAHENSKVAGACQKIRAPKEPFTEEACRDARKQTAEAIGRVLRDQRVDLVHMHGVDFHEYLPAENVPVLVTLHLPIPFYPPKIFQLQRPRTYLHCVSSSQQRECPPSDALLPVVENGVEVPRGRHAKRGFALALGRICPEKGFHHALDAARVAGISCLLAGEIFPYPSHREYFCREILPRLDQRRRFIGPVGAVRKRRLLAGARCVLIPSLVAETSSLVAMEALACGTPVIAFPSGALADIIEPGQTGYLVHNTKEMAEAIARTGELSAETCRASAARRFGLERMIDGYLHLYRQCLRPIKSSK